jgi:hypothetical protein
MLCGRPNDSIFHHDAIAPDLDATARLSHNARTIENAGAGTDSYITAYGGIGRNPSRRVDLRPMPCVFKQHR